MLSINSKLSQLKMSNYNIIIGGTRGIGLDIAKIFMKNKKKVLLLSRQKSKNINHRKFDINNPKDHSLEFGKIDNIVFSHRMRNVDPILDYETMVINPVNFIFRQINNLNKNASIIFLGSNAHKLVYKEQDAFYHASRGAIYSMTKFLAHNLGKKKIRVNCINPSTLIKKENKDYFSIKKNRLNLEKIIPTNEMTNSKNIAELCLFLCSKKSLGINGQVITVDNGLSVISQETILNTLNS